MPITKWDKRGWKLTETFGAPPTLLLPVGSPFFGSGLQLAFSLSQ